MWAYQSVFYQIYPIGFCDAPRVNDGVTVPRIRKVSDWAAHIASLGCNAVYFSPIFESDSNHRYDTADYRRIDPMLGTEEDFRTLCREAGCRGIRVMLDGVFNHTGSNSRYFVLLQKAGYYGHWPVCFRRTSGILE